MPDIVLDYHRLKTPIDHPDSSINKNKLIAEKTGITLAQWLWLSGMDVIHHENPNSDHTYTLLNFTMTDYAYITMARDGMRMPSRSQYPTWNSVYTHEMITGNSAADHALVVWVSGNGTRIGYEAVDLSDYHYLYALSVSGSSFKAYRGWVTAKTVASASPKFSVTNTQFSSGRYGVGFTRGGHQHYITSTYFTSPWSEAPKALALIELDIAGSGKPDDPFEPAFLSEAQAVELNSLPKEIAEAVKYNPKVRDKPIIDTAKVTWGSVDFRLDSSGKPIASTFVVAIFGDNQHQPGAIMKQVQKARSKNKRVFTYPFDYKAIYNAMKKDTDWLITENELAYQLSGSESLEIDAVADFYERETQLGRIKSLDPQIFKMWLERAKKLNRDNALLKLKTVWKR